MATIWRKVSRLFFPLILPFPTSEERTFGAWWGMRREDLKTETGARDLRIALNIAYGVSEGRREQERREEAE